MSCVLRGTAAEGAIRFFFANTKDIAERARQAHNTTPTASAALGRTLTAGTMMGLMLKDPTNILTITIKGDGPIGGITVTAAADGTVKGYVNNPSASLPLNKFGKLDVSGAVGNGSLTVIKDLGLKEPYVGQVPIISGEIAEDITYYFALSEQTRSACALGVLVDTDLSIKQSGGFILQLLPDADDDIITRLERRLGAIPSVTSMFESGLDIEGIVNRVLKDFNPVIMDRTETEFRCDCSRDKVVKALVSVGKKELEAMLNEDKKANVHCHFCNTDYDFDEEELKNIVNSL
ncbi:MAG: Hsp33 family molecular chaperone HslO [Clostridiales bacterium]|nr:Hsp33 family molecular chaperone HslO [Clostridiales bacterium]